MEHCRNAFATATVHHHAHCSSCCPFLLFDVVPCLHFFLFLPILSFVIAFGFGFFCNFPCSEQYISWSQGLYNQSITSSKTINGKLLTFPLLLFSASLSFILFSIFSAAKHPLMMTNQGKFSYTSPILEGEGH